MTKLGDRSTTRRLAVAALLTLFLLASSARASSQANAPEGVFLPRLTEHTDAFPAALISGTLLEADGCVFIGSDGASEERVLLIWPQETTADRTDDGTLRILVDGHVVGEMGDHVELGGGSVGERRNAVAQAESLIGTTIPDRCRTAAATS